jgi:uncharacterized membrane protein
MSRVRLVWQSLRNVFWTLPAIGIAFAIVAALVLPALDDSIHLPDAVSFNGGADTARALLQMIATVAVTVAGISFSVIVVALVLASQQMSPRVMRSFQRHPLNQTVLGVFLATAAYSIFLLGAIGDSRDVVPEFSVTIAIILAALSLGLFVVFLHHMVRSLNASAVIRRIAAEGHEAVESPYPAKVGAPPDDPAAAEREADELTASRACREIRARRAGYLASVEGSAIVAAAEGCDGFVEQRLAVGDFCLTGGLLAVAWGPEEHLDDLEERVVRAFVLNEERIVDGDTGFPLRQLSDIALKALSPSINDPTTAENAMDSVTDTLVRVARQPDPPLLRLGPSGAPRLRAAAPSLDDLVKLAFDQVRRDGGGRPSFSLRLLQLLSDLRQLGGPRAEGCEEIDLQARSIREEASARAEIPADAELIEREYERLHGGVRSLVS